MEYKIIRVLVNVIIKGNELIRRIVFKMGEMKVVFYLVFLFGLIFEYNFLNV